MPKPYVRFDEIKFEDDSKQEFCRLLYQEIVELEDYSMRDEEFYLLLKTVNEHAAEASLMLIDMNKKILFAMKMTFLYYTGVSPSMILHEDEAVDIFNLN